MSLVGIDASRSGWVAIVLEDDEPAQGHALEHLDELLEVVPDAQAVAIDIPIGLPSSGRRAADVAARVFVEARRASVFFTPVREALAEPTHAQASARSRELTGFGISQQAYALAPKILQAEAWSAGVSLPVWEVHPEVTFAVMMRRPARFPKSTWSGIRERQRALEQVGVNLDQVGSAGDRAAPDDVLDAAAAAWSAARLYRGEGICLPDPPELGEDPARPMAIWA